MSRYDDIEAGAAAARSLIDRRNNVDPNRPTDPQARHRYDMLRAERQIDPGRIGLRAEVSQEMERLEQERPDCVVSPNDPVVHAAVVHTMARWRAEGLIR